MDRVRISVTGYRSRFSDSIRFASFGWSAEEASVPGLTFTRPCPVVSFLEEPLRVACQRSVPLVSACRQEEGRPFSYTRVVHMPTGLAPCTGGHNRVHMGALAMVG